MQSTSAVTFPGEHRIHIGLAVTDLQRARNFYETLLGVAPSKRRAGYLKFEPHDPSVNLSLNEVADTRSVKSGATHFGVQVKSVDAVRSAQERLQQAGIATRQEEETTCCYALQTKVWATDPDGNEWEVFVVLESDVEEQVEDSSPCCSRGKDAASCC